MSRENVELVREAFDAVHTREPEVFLRYFPEDCIWYPLREWPGGAEAVRGHRGILEVMAVWRKSFNDYSAELHEVREVEDRVVCLGEQTGKIKGTEAPIRQRFGIVCSDFRDGMVGEMRFFRGWQETLEAAGVSE